MKKTILSLALAACSLTAAAQSDMHLIYNEAQNNYEIGKLEEARDLLKANLTQFTDALQIDAYHLLALCSIALDEDEAAEQYTAVLLDRNPYYTPSNTDPDRFADLVNRIREGRTVTITTASHQAESVAEAPVPVTVITHDMIRYSGASSLHDILLAYVPGITPTDYNNDEGVVMRGVMSTAPQEILYMLNGHRLNNYSTNAGSIDRSFSLDKIKRIEVLRGAASSLYGGAALAGVINIITKDGIDQDGLTIKAGAGNFGQFKADAVFGKRFFDLDVLVWGGFYKATGEKRELHNYNILQEEDGSIRLGSTGNAFNHDFGVSLKYKGLELLYNNRFSHKVPPYTNSTLHGLYDFDRYGTIRGNHVGTSKQETHAELSYGEQVGAVFLKGKASLDVSDVTYYEVVYDQAMSRAGYMFAPLFPSLTQEELAQIGNISGLYYYRDGQDRNYGLEVSGDYAYSKTRNHNGNLTFGVRFDHYQLSGVRVFLGGNYNQVVYEPNDIANLGIGHENSANAYVQLKHQWRHFILNSGVRYDYKYHYDGKSVHVLSPRLSLIYLQPTWNIKLSYSKAFVDAPYYYRKANLLALSDQKELDPETMHSFQLTWKKNLGKGLDVELNGFYNIGRDLFMEVSTGYYMNTGINKRYGAELLASWQQPNYGAHLALNWQNLDTWQLNGENMTDRYVPKISAKTVAYWKPIKNLELHTNINFFGQQKEMNYDPEINDYRLPAQAIVHVGATYKYKKAKLSFNVRNLLNSNYRAGNLIGNTIEQPGRSFLAELSYRF